MSSRSFVPVSHASYLPASSIPQLSPVLLFLTMKILHIGKYYPPFHGGMETFLHELAQAQADYGMDVHVLAHNHSNRASETSHVGKVDVIRAGSLGTVFFTPVSPTFRSHLKKQLADFQPDILHLHLPNPSAFWVMTLAEARSVPWVVHWHADVVSSQIDWRVKTAYRFYRPMEQALLKRCRRVIVTSPPYLESSRPLAGWKSKCHVIPLGMRSSPQAPPDAVRGFQNADGLKVLAVGRLTYYKGFEYLIGAAELVDKIQILLVGDGEKRKELQQLIQTRRLEEKVHLAGKLSDEQLVQLFNDCDCLCLPSIERTEAFGMVILEAARAGKPAVVTDVPGSGMSWVVENNKTGIVVPCANTKELAKALQHLSRQKSVCSEMGVHARKRFDTMFRIEAIEKQVSDLYSDILL